MSFHYHPRIGTFHLQEAQPRRVVPGPERHRWDSKPKWGEPATCRKCGCEKLRLKTQPGYTERYRLPGTAQLLPERPPCPGPAAPAPPPTPLGPAGPTTAPAPPTPTRRPGLTTTYDAPAPYRHD